MHFTCIIDHLLHWQSKTASYWSWLLGSRRGSACWVSVRSPSSVGPPAWCIVYPRCWHQRDPCVVGAHLSMSRRCISADTMYTTSYSAQAWLIARFLRLKLLAAAPLVNHPLPFLGLKVIHHSSWWCARCGSVVVEKGRGEQWGGACLYSARGRPSDRV
jgi:hypothetical protein